MTAAELINSIQQFATEQDAAIKAAADQVELYRHNAADLQGQLDAARKQIADLEVRLNLPPVITPAKNPPIMVIDFATRMAGLPIHVHAMQTPGVDQLSDIQWDFGDPKGRFNNLPGFNAAHVYETPGTYAITLRIDSQAIQRMVNITPAAVNPIAKLGDAKDNCRNVLTVDAIELSGTFWPKINNASIEGKQGKTILLYTGKDPNAGIISCPNECTDLTLRGLTFDSDVSNGATRATAIYQQLASLALIDCSAQRLNYFVASESKQNNKACSGLLILGCSAPIIDGIHGYFAWVACDDAVILGNYVANVFQHVVRMGYYDRVLIYGNDFTNADTRPKNPDDEAKGCIVCQRGSHVWVEQNKSRLGGIGVGPLGGNDGISDKAGRTVYAVVKNNTVDGGNCISVMHGAAHVRVQDNIIDRGKNDLSGIEVDGFDATYNRTVEDLSVTGNRQIRTGGVSPAVLFKTPGQVGVNNTDNLIVLPTDKTALNGKGAA